jgi:hypothetical protein
VDEETLEHLIRMGIVEPNPGWVPPVPPAPERSPRRDETPVQLFNMGIEL